MVFTIFVPSAWSYIYLGWYALFVSVPRESELCWVLGFLSGYVWFVCFLTFVADALVCSLLAWYWVVCYGVVV